VPARLATLSEYELRHLGRHLADAGNSRHLRHLLHLDAEDGRNTLGRIAAHVPPELLRRAL
jgi:hypothetical protein